MVQAALQKAAQAARPAVRPRPEHAQPLHGRRDDRQQRLRLPRAGLRPDVGQRGRPRRRHRRRRAAAAGRRHPPTPGASAELRALVDGELGDDPHRAGPVRPAGVGLRAGAPAARARLRRRPGAGRQRGHARPWSSAPPCGWSPTRPYRGLVVLGYPTMPDAADATPGAAAARPHGRRGPGRADGPAAARRPGRRRPGPAARRRLADRRADRRQRRRGARPRRRGVLADAGALDSLVVTDAAAGRGDLADPRGRRRAGGPHQRRPPGARRLGGRRRPGRAAGRLPPRLRGPARRARAAVRALRALRRRLHARADRLPVRLDGPGPRPGAATGRSSRTPPAWSPATAGSISGEHGDGRARGELLRYMYSARASSALFERVKARVRPRRRAQPRRPGAARRRSTTTSARPPAPAGASGWRWPTGTTAATSPTPSTAAPASASAAPTCRPPAGVMCPSWPATREEKDTTRGRARVLQEMLAPGGPVRDWRSPEVHDALDLCLSCKGCSRDCPTGVDMASYKAEVLHQSYRRRLRPRSHYTLGRLPRWADLAARAPRLVNAVARLPARRAAGQVVGRGGPAPRPCRRSPGAPSASSGPTRPAAVAGRARRWRCGWTRSPTTSRPEVALAAARVLEAAGYRVQVPGADTCCGLTWITTGQLDTARKILRPHRRDPRPAGRAPACRSSGVEPSCTAALRSEALELRRRRRPRSGWPPAPARWPSCSPRRPAGTPPSLAGVEVVAQPHCHHASVMGWSADAQLLARRRRARHPARRLLRAGRQLGRRARPPRRVGGDRRAAAAARGRGTCPDGAVVLADGFSCRTQLDQLAGRRGLHLAELLADRLP